MGLLNTTSDCIEQHNDNNAIKESKKANINDNALWKTEIHDPSST